MAASISTVIVVVAGAEHRLVTAFAKHEQPLLPFPQRDYC